MAADTTYSDTRSVPKQEVYFTPQTGLGSATISVSDDGESSGILQLSDEEKAKQTFFQSCMEPDEIKSLAELGGYFVSLPFRLGACYLVDNFRVSHIELFTGKPNMISLPKRNWRYGWGFGFGAVYMPEAGGGVPFSLHFEALHSLSSQRQWRVHLGTFGSILQTTTDYERTILLDKLPIGVQRDQLTQYSQSGYPVLFEKLWTNEKGLYLSTGAGAVALRETINIFRTSNIGGTPEERIEKQHSLFPLFSLSIGRFAERGGGSKYHRFEIRYQATVLIPNHRSSFPSDNASSMHSLTWNWGWLW